MVDHPEEVLSAAQDRHAIPLMEGLRNLETGYDRKFALSYCADDVWAALEALERVLPLVVDLSERGWIKGAEATEIIREALGHAE